MSSTLTIQNKNMPGRSDAGTLDSLSPAQIYDLLFENETLTPKATPLASDLVLIQDLADGRKLKTVTTQSIADLIGAGDVQGPAAAADNALARFDLLTGKLIQNSVAILTDAGALSGLTSLGMGGALTGVTTLTMSGALTGATTFEFAPVNAALVTPTANILINSALGDFDLIVGGDTNANLLMVDAGLDAVGIGAAAVSGSILTLNTTTSPIEFIESVFNAGLTTPAGTIAGYLRVEIGGNVLYINAYSVIPS